MHDEHQVPIWFFIGGLLLTYGLLIAGSGIYGAIRPPPESERVALWNLHADIWWSLFMAAVGLFYCIRFNPLGHHQNITGEEEAE
jgi:hypothetical protein